MLDLTAEDLWVIATCTCCAVACAIPGVFLMLRKASMLGDAVSHAILPGLAVSFIVTGSRDPAFMLVGALGAGLLTAVLSSFLHRTTNVSEDASLGIVFTSFFALGVILVTWAARDVDLDPGCVLYGLAEFVPFDTISILGRELPRSFVWLALLVLVNTTLTILFYKELLISTFDPALARSLGFGVRKIHYALLTCVTVTAVASFEAVGSILVVAMLITPAATAYLVSNRLPWVLAIAVLCAVISSVGGYLGALALNTSVAGMMSVVIGCLFATAVVFSPTHGYAKRCADRVSLGLKIIRDDMLGILFRWHEVVGPGQRNPLMPRDMLQALDVGFLGKVALWMLRRSGDLFREQDGSLRLTERGIVEASAIVRSHRLWEAYLAKHLSLPLDHLHAPSERTEHYIGRALAREIEAEVDGGSDPHGRSIPKG